MLGKKISHGRGGMGNISTDPTEYVDGTVYSPPMLTVRLCALSRHITDILDRQDVIHATALAAVGRAISANSTPLKRELLKIFRMVVMPLSQGAGLDEVVMGITLKCVNASVSNMKAGRVVDLKNRLGRVIRQRALCLQLASLDSEIGLGH